MEGDEAPEVDQHADDTPSGQILVHRKGRIAPGSYLASWKAKELADRRWAKERAKKAEMSAWAQSSGGQKGQPMPQPAEPPPPPSSTAQRAISKTNPCANMIVRGGPGTWRGLPVVQAPGTPFGTFEQHQEKRAIEAAQARRSRRRR